MGNWCSRASQSTQFSSTNQTIKELTINDLPLLCNTLNPVASKCFDLGLQFGVKYPQIRAIEHNYRHCEDQLSEIISERLKQDSPLTWNDIVTALRSPTVGENTLASEIERDHIHNLQPPTSVAPQVSTVSSVPPTSSPLISAQNLLPVRGALGGEHSMTPQQIGPPHGENYHPPTLMSGQILGRGPQHGENYQPPTQMMGQTPVRGPPHGENFQPSSYYPPDSPAWEFPGRVAQGTPQYGTQPLKYTPYIDVVNKHSDVLTETISGDLTFFINKFIELGFVTRTATANVLSQHGVGNGEKAGQLLSLLTAHYNSEAHNFRWAKNTIFVARRQKRKTFSATVVGSSEFTLPQR